MKNNAPAKISVWDMANAPIVKSDKAKKLSRLANRTPKSVLARRRPSKVEIRNYL